jgi:hypothetical protein
MGRCHDTLPKVQIVTYELPTGFFMYLEKDRPYMHEEWGAAIFFSTSSVNDSPSP